MSGNSETFDIVSFLSSYSLFNNLSNPILNSVAAKTTIESFAPNEVIFNEGDEGNSFHLITSGHVRCIKERDGEELVLAELGLGEGFGEIALMSKVPRTCTVKALDQVQTLVLNREDFAELYRTLPELAVNFDLMKKQRVSLLEQDGKVNSEVFSSSHHVGLDYTNLDLLMKLNEAAGGHEQVEHCKETGQLASEMSKILCPMVSDILLFAGYLHEIGKISIPRDLNIKERQGQPLTKEEKELFSRTYEASVEILRPNENLCKSMYFLSYLGHENYKDMPLEAQILKVANDFLEYRASSYRGLTDEEAMEEMRRGSGTKYNPNIITALEKNIDKYKGIRVEAQLNVMRMIVKALDSKDNYTYRHSMDVRNVALLLADRLELDNKQKGYIKIGSELHDAGKIFIDENILNAPRKLTDDEFKIMQTHAIYSSEFFKDIFGMEQVAAIVRAHHEKYNGMGYPDKLKGEEIPYSARIMAIADVWSALTTPRVYRSDSSGRKAFTMEKALSIMEEMAGTDHFDPKMFPVFRELVQDAMKEGKETLSSEFSEEIKAGK